MAILTPALDEVIWANGPGATLFGFSDIEAIIGAEPADRLCRQAADHGDVRLSAHRQGSRDHGRLASGMTSRAVAFAASEIALPDGEEAILLAVPAQAAAWRSPSETAARAIAGLDQAGQYAAIVDAEGGVVAASPGFESLGIAADTLAALVAEARGERLVKRMIAAAAASLPAGFVRLTDDPATHLLAVIDEVPDAVEEEPEHAVEEQAPADAALPPDSVIPAETSVEPAPGEQTIAADAKAVDAARGGGFRRRRRSADCRAG